MRSTIGTALPIYAISTMKGDEHGNLYRTKYRIVVLENLDPHNWTKIDFFVPVIAQMDFRVMISLACHLRIPPKQGDFVQTFC